MTNKTFSVGSLKLKIVDVLIIATLSFFSIIAIIFSWKIDGWWILVSKNVFVGIIFLVFLKFSELAQKKFLKFFLRVAAVTLTYAYLFGAVDKLQLIIHNNWLDDSILSLEQSIFGVQPILWLQPYISKPLTEWMMFSYVAYVPMYPILCGIIFYKHGELGMEDYFFTLGFTNVLCDIGFILFPVASPMYHPIKELFTVPLDGWVWTYLGELMRKYLHFAGGSIPSPHAAAGTIMWAMAYRYYRIGFWVLAPIMISLYISTFYGRYHYVTDAVVGILVALIALKVSPFLMKWWDELISK